LAFFLPPLMAIGALWMVTIPGGTLLLAVHFRRRMRADGAFTAHLPAFTGSFTGGDYDPGG
jgi:hypothetical protein